MASIFSRSSRPAIWLRIAATSLLGLVSLSALAADEEDLEKAWLGKPVFAKVGLHADWKSPFYQSYSTNYIGVQEFFPVNSRFVIKSLDKEKITLDVAETKKEMILEFVPKHNLITLSEYLGRTFSPAKVSLPGNLSKTELAQINRGDYAVGMSREALFLSVGYPPASLNPDLKGRQLKYSKKRFSSVVFEFEGDKISKVQE